jgi:hypothetical protein
LYQNSRNYVRSKNNRSKEFITVDGLRQGGVLSRLLFIIMMDEIINWIYRERASRKSQHMEQSITRTTDENKHSKDKNNGNNQRREKCRH